MPSARGTPRLCWGEKLRDEWETPQLGSESPPHPPSCSDRAESTNWKRVVGYGTETFNFLSGKCCKSWLGCDSAAGIPAAAHFASPFYVPNRSCCGWVIRESKGTALPRALVTAARSGPGLRSLGVCKPAIATVGSKSRRFLPTYFLEPSSLLPRPPSWLLALCLIGRDFGSSFLCRRMCALPKIWEVTTFCLQVDTVGVLITTDILPKDCKFQLLCLTLFGSVFL